MAHDYIPKTDAELLAFARNLYAYALGNYERWQVPDPKAKAEELPSVFQTGAVRDFQWGEDMYGRV
ncbi:MAG: hypothetical protein LBI91_01115 [Spirochaetaceae bacterium]|jgi:hypothetical protein|nr:hypothetical protein [Spirochaetaceae bacterium]